MYTPLDLARAAPQPLRFAFSVEAHVRQARASVPSTQYTKKVYRSALLVLHSPILHAVYPYMVLHLLHIFWGASSYYNVGRQALDVSVRSGLHLHDLRPKLAAAVEIDAEEDKTHSWETRHHVVTGYPGYHGETREH